MQGGRTEISRESQPLFKCDTVGGAPFWAYLPAFFNFFFEGLSLSGVRGRNATWGREVWGKWGVWLGVLIPSPQADAGALPGRAEHFYLSRLVLHALHPLGNVSDYCRVNFSVLKSSTQFCLLKNRQVSFVVTMQREPKVTQLGEKNWSTNRASKKGKQRIGLGRRVVQASFLQFFRTEEATLLRKCSVGSNCQKMPRVHFAALAAEGGSREGEAPENCHRLFCFPPAFPHPAFVNGGR